MYIFKFPGCIVSIILCLTLPSCGLFSAGVKDKEISTLENKIANKDQRILELENRINSLENKITLLQVPQKNSRVKIPKSMAPVPLYKKARHLLMEERFIQSGETFKFFVKKYPKHDLADNALYWQGESHYSLGRFTEAIKIFKRLIIDYPTAEKVPDAMLKTAYSYLSVDDVNRANYYLKQVLLKYPFSPAAEKAQEKLKLFN